MHDPIKMKGSGATIESVDKERSDAVVRRNNMQRHFDRIATSPTAEVHTLHHTDDADRQAARAAAEGGARAY